MSEASSAFKTLRSNSHQTYIWDPKEIVWKSFKINSYFGKEKTQKNRLNDFFLIVIKNIVRCPLRYVIKPIPHKCARHMFFI